MSLILITTNDISQYANQKVAVKQVKADQIDNDGLMDFLEEAKGTAACFLKKIVFFF